MEFAWQQDLWLEVAGSFFWLMTATTTPAPEPVFLNARPVLSMSRVLAAISRQRPLHILERGCDQKPFAARITFDVPCLLSLL